MIWDWIEILRLSDGSFLAWGFAQPGDKGVGESAGINRLGVGNERVLQGELSQLLWPRTVRR